MKYYINVKDGFKTLYQNIVDVDNKEEAGMILNKKAVELSCWDQSKYTRIVRRAGIRRNKVDQGLWFYDDLGNRLDEDKIKREHIEDFKIDIQRYKDIDTYKYTKIKWSYDNEDLVNYQYTKKLLHKDDNMPIGGPEIRNISVEEYGDMKNRYLIIQNLRYWEISENAEIIKYHSKKEQRNLFYEIFILLVKEIDDMKFMSNDITKLKTKDIENFLRLVLLEIVKDKTLLRKIEERIS